MSVLISGATGNFTAASTWLVASAVANSFLDSEAASTALTTTPTDSVAATLGVATHRGVMVKVQSRVASPTGNLILVLRNTTAGIDVSTITIAVSDITAGGVTWLFAKFAVDITTAGATNYAVRASCSVNGEVTLYRDGTAGNWSRYIVTTTTAAPAASDGMHIVGHQAGGGAITAYTVTMDNTASTTFGTVAPTEALSVNHGGTLTWGTTASTNYLLTIKGKIRILAGGTWNCGTSGTRMPSSSTATLQFKPTSSLDSNFVCESGGTHGWYGTRPDHIYSLMTADAAAAATAVTVASATGWGGTDRIGIAPTNRTYSEAEIRDLTSISTNTLNFTGGLSAAHSGNATGGPNSESTQAEVVNLTRNVRILGDTDSLHGYTITNGTGVGVFDSVYTRRMGTLSNSRGAFGFTTTTGSITVTYCACEGNATTGANGIYSASASADNLTASYNVFYGMAAAIIIAATTGTTLSVTESVIIGGFSNSSAGLTISDRGTVVTNIRASGVNGNGISLTESASFVGSHGGSFGGMSGLIAHSCASAGINFTLVGGTASNLKAWRNGTTGVTASLFSSVLDTVVAFGNTPQNVSINGVYQSSLNALTCDGEASFASTYNISLGICTGTTISNAALSSVTSPTTAEVFLSTPTSSPRFATFINCAHAAMFITTAELGTSVWDWGRVVSLKHDGTSGDHRQYVAWGYAQTDTSIYGTASPSVRINPVSANGRVKIPCGEITVASGGNPTITVKVRESVSGDGTDYNGVRPRLMVKANPLAGISSDTALATATVACEGAFETLSGSTGAVSADCVLEFYVDCGFTGWTGGWVNVDDFTCSTNADTKGMKYWGSDGPFVVSDNAAASVGGNNSPFNGPF